MPNVLTDAQIAQYKRENFLAPFPALTQAETRHYRDCLENYERTQGGAPLEPWQYRKLHVREEWAADLVRMCGRGMGSLTYGWLTPGARTPLPCGAAFGTEGRATARHVRRSLS